MRLDRRRFLGLAAGLTAISESLVAACAQSTASAPTTLPAKPTANAATAPQTAPAAAGAKKVSVRFNWTMKGEFTPLVIAREKGFYKEQGIEADLLEGKSGTQAAQVVATGSDQFGYIPSVQVIQGINQGMPIQTVATCGRNTGMCWAAHAGVPLDGPKSLEGRKVSISTSSTFFQVWEAFARKFGVDKSKVEVVAADPSARVGLFLQNQVEIMADIFLANDYVILQNRAKEKLNLLKLADLGYDPVGYVLAANKSVMGDAGIARGFTQATLKGLQYTLDHPDEATQIMTRLYGDNLGASVIDGQIKQLLPLINKDPGLGTSDQAAWNHSLDILLESGVIDKKLAMDQYLTNDFVAG
jgi:NitT/TauT family transport system substrate-binding protein